MTVPGRAGRRSYAQLGIDKATEPFTETLELGGGLLLRLRSEPLSKEWAFEVLADGVEALSIVCDEPGEFILKMEVIRRWVKTGCNKVKKQTYETHGVKPYNV